MTWAVAALSLLATWLNVRGQRTCFAIWIVTNVVWAGTCASRELHAQSALHLVYAGLAVWGLIRWARHPAPGDPCRP